MNQKANLKVKLKNDISLPLFNNKIKEERLLTKKEMADFLNVSVKTIDKKVHLNEIPFYKVGRLVRFDITEILAWAKKNSSSR